MTTKLDDLRRALRYDWPFYAESCLKIVNKKGDLVPFKPKPQQILLDEKLEAQRAAGRPMRVLILKARQIGYSTYAQAKAIQRATQRENHMTFTVAQDSRTAGKLFEMGEIMYVNLPDDADLALKPTIRNRRHQRALYFGSANRLERERGAIGLNSAFLVDTAKEVEAGRGFTCHTLHLSEVAFWPDVRKLRALLSSVPDEPETLIMQESTANGFNHFKDAWDKAERGAGGYVTHFSPWQEEPDYQMAFLDDEDREAFIDSIGTGPYGEDEAGLMELGCAPEQLQWRRNVIEDRFQGDARIFKQEFPATAAEAFLSSGDTVFSPIRIEAVLRKTKETDPLATHHELRATERVPHRGPHGMIEVPREPVLVDARVREEGVWRIWAEPEPAGTDEDGKRTPPGQYVIGVDPSSGEAVEPGRAARHAIQVIDHRTLEQVAEYVSREDPDLIAEQAFMAACLYNNAWLAVEVTGGYGLSINRRIGRQGFKYPFLYQRKKRDAPNQGELERYGWSTDVQTKPEMVDRAKELLRLDKDGLKSQPVALEMQTYVLDERGRMDPSPGNYADRLMAWMIALMVAGEKPIKPDRQPGDVVSTSTHRVRSTVTGW